MARVGAGLSPGQRNDWVWFRASWDKAMVAEHKSDWGKKFAGWMQAVLDSVLDSGHSNAFSRFVYNETCRIFHGSAALHVP